MGEGFSGIQIVITALLSSGLVGGLVAFFTKKSWSPESKNELARIGNEFARHLLEEARSEREELRSTIKELEELVLEKTDAIERLKHLANEKDAIIRELEDRKFLVARKVQLGEVVTLQDVFGSYIPKEYVVKVNPKEQGNG